MPHHRPPRAGGTHPAHLRRPPARRAHPNLFPEGESQGLSHTADATLWFFHAVDRYTRLSGDGSLVRELLPVFREIVARHLAGTRFGIGVDAEPPHAPRGCIAQAWSVAEVLRCLS